MKKLTEAPPQTEESRPKESNGTPTPDPALGRDAVLSSGEAASVQPGLAHTDEVAPVESERITLPISLDPVDEAARRKAETLSQRETLPLVNPPTALLHENDSFNETTNKHQRPTRKVGWPADSGSSNYRRDEPNEQTVETPLTLLATSSAYESGGIEVSGWGGMLIRQRSSFFRQVFLWLLTISLLMAGGSGAIYYSRQLRFIEEDREQRADLLLGYLATQSQTGAYAGDKIMLEHPVRRMLDQKDVVYVAVYDTDGRELIKSSARPGLAPPDPPIGWLDDVVHAAQKEVETRPRKSRNLLEEGISQRIKKRLDEKFDCLDLYAAIIITDRGGPGIAPYVDASDTVMRDRVVGVVRIGLSLKAAANRLREVVTWGVGLGLLLMGLGATAAYFIAGRISVPILELCRGADEIRAGNLHPRIQVQRSDEIGMLAESFSRMAERLAESMSALSRLNRDLEGEVKRRTRQIRLAYAFTSVLNSPIDRSDDAMDAADLTVMLDQALAALVEATGTRGGGVFLTDEATETELLVRAAFGVSTHTLGTPPSLAELKARLRRNTDGGQVPVPLHEAVQVKDSRISVPLVFRNHPLGVLLLILPSGAGDDDVEPSLLEFVRQAAAQLAIAVSNARAYSRMTLLAQELRQRSETLAAQRDQVKAQRDQLEEQRNQLEEQRNQLEAQSIQLRIQRNQLREVNRLKSEFLANVSHELRTPLNAIMGYSELIHDEIYGPISSDAHDAVAGVLASSANLLRLINQILDLSRIEAGRMDLYAEAIDIHAVCNAVIKEAEAMGRDRPYRVQLHCPRDLRVETDPVKLQQILTNLIANAIKFTAQGSVEVIVEVEVDGHIRIDVKDTGIGIRPEHLELIFEEFRQVDGSSTRRFGGTGLGLAIARRLAELLGAEISVASTYNVGSTFSIRLPKRPPSRTSARPRNRELDSNPLLPALPALPGLVTGAEAYSFDGILPVAPPPPSPSGKTFPDDVPEGARASFPEIHIETSSDSPSSPAAVLPAVAGQPFDGDDEDADTNETAAAPASKSEDPAEARIE